MAKFGRLFSALLLLAVLFFALIPPLPAWADGPGSKISGDLERVILLKQSLKMPLPAGAARLTQGVNGDMENLLVFLYMEGQPDAHKLAELAALGVTAYPASWIPPVGAHARGFITASVPIGRVAELAARPDVAWIDSAEKQVHACNDMAAQVTGADTFWPSGFNGAGITVAVLDSGLDTTHPDIPACVASKDYSQYPVLGDNITTHGVHGTHVTGSVLGRGTLSGGRYKGMAWGSKLVFLKIEDDATGRASSAAMAAALRAAADTYSANIINMSFGGFSGFHDGSDAMCQAVDYANSRGVLVFISAGNEAGNALHYSKLVPARSTTAPIKINIFNSTGSNCTLSHNVVWFDGKNTNNSITAAYYDTGMNPLAMASTTWNKDDRGTSQRYWWWGEESGLEYNIPAGATTCYMTLTNNSDNQQLCHIYFNGTAKNGGSVTFDQPDVFYTLGSPAEADSAVAIGCYTDRGWFVNYLGDNRTENETPGTVSTFSSRGPRVDSLSVIKPFIVSPGSLVISCRDRVGSALGPDSVSNNGVNDGSGPADYLGIQGTSMASPVAAGCAALILQSYPGLKGKPEAVKQYLRQSASRPSQPDFTWGYGLFSLKRILQILPKAASIEIPGGQGRITYSTDLGTVSSLTVSSSQSTYSNGLNLMPWGTYTYRVSLLDPSGWSHIYVEMPNDIPDEYLAYEDGLWEQVPLSSDIGNEINFRLQDAGVGDTDNQSDGSIEATGGPAIAGDTGIYTGTRTGSGSSTSATPSMTPPVITPTIVVQSASLSDRAVMPGQPASLAVRLSNTSTVNGQAPLRVYVNGEVDALQAVNLAAGQAVSLVFLIQRDEPGTYYVQVNNMAAGTFTVEDPVAQALPVMLVFMAFLLSIAYVSVLLWKRCRAGA